ncbi:hypothetical protein SAMN04488095_2639 [Jannaschia pohangensis]|uniref:Hemolysin-type calcium-binding repeat-containing protein n=2 Tax=Jannaschia pohangensis TaxID=390807 RepID=A0A1I3QQN8_9RHOB|nr:hypothetical protein SAMN04488095_2639 [Jannaschia pohangensis]
MSWNGFWAGWFWGGWRPPAPDPRPEPEPGTPVDDKDAFLDEVDHFYSSVRLWNFYHQKNALLDRLEEMFEPGDEAIRDAFLDKVSDIIGDKWSFLWNKWTISVKLEKAICDVIEQMNPPIGSDDDDCPEGPPEITVQFNGTVDDDILTVADNASGTVAGNDGDDLINGAGYDDFLLGNRGDDQLNGNCGNDTLHGGLGDDLIDGGSGDDVILAGFGFDTITGGSGADTFRLIDRLTAEDSFDIVQDFSAEENDQFDLADIDASRVTVTQNGDDAEIRVDGDVEFLVLDSDVALIEAAIIYDDVLTS